MCPPSQHEFHLLLSKTCDLWKCAVEWHDMCWLNRILQLHFLTLPSFPRNPYICHHQITFTSSASCLWVFTNHSTHLVNSYSFFHIQLKHQLLSKAIRDPEDQLSLGLVLYISEGEWEVKSSNSKKRNCSPFYWDKTDIKLLILKCSIQWHSVYLQCLATIISV